MVRRFFAGPSRRRRLSPTAAVLVLTLTSCAPWSSIPAPAPTVLPPATQVQVWRHGRAVVLRDVNITADSVAGRVVNPLGRGPWVAMPRTEVDSFKTRPLDRANWFGAGAGAGFLVGVAGTFAFCQAAQGS